VIRTISDLPSSVQLFVLFVEDEYGQVAVTILQLAVEALNRRNYNGGALAAFPAAK
jgi:hypothetical protein